MQPLIQIDQVDITIDNLWQQFPITAQTKTNSFQEVFIDGISVEIYSANSSTDVFVVSGDYTTYFTSGIDFHVSGSASNDGDYTTISDATFSAGFTTIYVTTVPTTEGAGLGTGFISTGERLVLPEDSSTLISVFAVARDAVTAAAVAGMIVKAVFSRDTTLGSVLRIGTVLTDISRESLTGTPDVDLTADTTNGSIKIEFKGGSTNLVYWKAIVLLQQITV